MMQRYLEVGKYEREEKPLVVPTELEGKKGKVR